VARSALSLRLAERRGFIHHFRVGRLSLSVMEGLDEWLPPASCGHRNRLIDRAGVLFIEFSCEQLNRAWHTIVWSDGFQLQASSAETCSKR
jgi:hypothetical protein